MPCSDQGVQRVVVLPDRGSILRRLLLVVHLHVVDRLAVLAGPSLGKLYRPAIWRHHISRGHHDAAAPLERSHKRRRVNTDEGQRQNARVVGRRITRAVEKGDIPAGRAATVRIDRLDRGLDAFAAVALAVTLIRPYLTREWWSRTERRLLDVQFPRARVPVVLGVENATDRDHQHGNQE